MMPSLLVIAFLFTAAAPSLVTSYPAPMCVWFDADGHLVTALVEGPHSKASSIRILKDLRDRHWAPPPRAIRRKWIGIDPETGDLVPFKACPDSVD